MDDRENISHTPQRGTSRVDLSSIPDVDATPMPSAHDTGSFPASNDELLSGTGNILAAASYGADLDEPYEAEVDERPAPEPAPAPRYVRRRTPHRSQGTLDDLSEENEPTPNYTHDSNISVGGSTPLSGMSYRRARSNMSKVSGSRYGQYLEIPKGRRSIFASRERARRRRSVLALFIVVTLLVLAAMFIWNLMQSVLG